MSGVTQISDLVKGGRYGIKNRKDEQQSISNIREISHEYVELVISTSTIMIALSEERMKTSQKK